MASLWGITPRTSVELECAKRGVTAVVQGCLDILGGLVVDDELVRALAGPAAEAVLDGREGGRHGYWPRVWALRGLLYAWEDGPAAVNAAVAALVGATTDESWRVREMAAKVIAHQRLGDATDGVAALRDDPVPRVRAAAARAVAVITAAGA